MTKRITARLEKLETDQKPEVSIGVSWRTDGLIEWTLPNGETELITEAEYLARGGKIVRWTDHELTKDQRKGLR